MVDNITEKVVKRLVQVTSAMKQDGENRVGLIKSQTAYKVSQKMAEASATRPAVVGQALNEIAKRDPDVLEAVLDVMEVQNLVESGAEIDVLPANAQVFVQLGGGAPAIEKKGSAKKRGQYPLMKNAGKFVGISEQGVFKGY